MKKTIILNENAFKKIKRLIVKEAITNAPTFGKFGDYTGILRTLDKVENLHTDRYKDYELEESWKNWENTGFNKNCKEYSIYLSNFKNFMFGGRDGENRGFLGNVSYVIDRLGGTLNHFILSREWSDAVGNNPHYKYSDLKSNKGSEEKQCFYTTILKLYQNPAIWNDFFFNPEFKDYAQKFFKIRDKLSDIFKRDPEGYKSTYLQILPKKEYAELNKFVGIIDKTYDEAGKLIGWEIRNKVNQKEDLFYNPPKYDDEEDEYGV